MPPPWLGTRPLPLRPDGYGQAQPTPPELDPRRFTLPDTLAPLPGDGFASVVEQVPAEVLARSTWAAGCPVGPDDLAYVQLTFWGFDDQRHTGELLLNRSVADDVVGVFRTLYESGFRSRSCGSHTRSELDAHPTGDGNNTESFVCRPTTGSTSTFSQHAYGLAIDLDPFQNPYTNGDLVLPELASSYLDRDDVRPGMITPDGVVVRAFESIEVDLGRHLALAQGLPALQPERSLSSSTTASWPKCSAHCAGTASKRQSLTVGVGPELEQQPHHRDVAVAGGRVQPGLPLLVGGDVGAGCGGRRPSRARRRGVRRPAGRGRPPTPPALVVTPPRPGPPRRPRGRR